jgi:hypothetical protein
VVRNPNTPSVPLPVDGAFVPVEALPSEGVELKSHCVMIVAAETPRESPIEVRVVRIIVFIKAG